MTIININQLVLVKTININTSLRIIASGVNRTIRRGVRCSTTGDKVIRTNNGALLLFKMP